MHDSLGHTLALLTMQAGALQVNAGAEVSGQADQIRRTARSALGDLRSVVRALGEQVVGREPGPTGLAGVPGLVEAGRRSGADIDLHLDLPDPDDQSVPPAIGRVIYQTVREALTNAHRHAPAAPVLVEIAGRAGSGIAVTVTNPLAPGGESGNGTGLASLAERVGLLGGRSFSGAARGEFTVVVELPWEVSI